MASLWTTISIGMLPAYFSLPRCIVKAIAWGSSSLGEFMVAESAHGLVACEFAGQRAAVEVTLRSRFSYAVVVEAETSLAYQIACMKQAIEVPGVDP